MKLCEYLEVNGITQKFFSKKIGVNPTHLSRWVSGKTIPRINYIMEVEKATNGAVSARDWVGELKI